MGCFTLRSDTVGTADCDSNDDMTHFRNDYFAGVTDTDVAADIASDGANVSSVALSYVSDSSGSVGNGASTRAIRGTSTYSWHRHWGQLLVVAPVPELRVTMRY